MKMARKCFKAANVEKVAFARQLKIYKSHWFSWLIVKEMLTTKAIMDTQMSKKHPYWRTSFIRKSVFFKTPMTLMNLKITIKCPRWCLEGWLWQRETTRTARMIRKCQETSASQSCKAQLFIHHLKKKAKTFWTMIKINWQFTQQQQALLTSLATWSTFAMALSEAQRGPPATRSTSISKYNHLALSEEKTMQTLFIQGSKQRWLSQILVRTVMET